MYHRVFDIEEQLDEGMFLFGARQVGKSTLLKERFPVSLDPITRISDDIELLYVTDFFKMLWDGEIF